MIDTEEHQLRQHGRDLSDCGFRSVLEKLGRSGTDRGRRNVVHDVGKIRAVGAAAIAAGVVLSGCASGGGEESPTTTTSSAAAGPVNPWDLPIEQRPALFDPCAELPVEAVEQGLGGPVELIERHTRHQPGELMMCGWKTEEAGILAVSTWKSRDEYLTDRAFTVVDREHELGGRIGMRLLDAADRTERSCLQLFFTERGTIWLKFDFRRIPRQFKGERSDDACLSLEQSLPPMMSHFPKGDFK